MAGPADPPQVWILWRRRKGDLDQMLALTDALGWPVTIKTLHFRGPDVPVLAPLVLASHSDPLAPPWPDLVICAEALPSVIARRLKQQSGGRIRTVCLARPAGRTAPFDLVITTAQYRLQPAPNILELGLPLAPARPPSDAPHAPSGRIAVAVGGASFPDRLDAAVASELAATLSAYAADRGKRLDVITSPRTAPDAVAALRQSVRAPHLLHVFTPGAANPYRDLLAAADEIVVTSDSVSMTADALESGRPVSIYRLPQTRNLQWHVSEWLHAHAAVARRWWLKPVTRAFETGLIEATADRHLLFDRLAGEGRLTWFGTPPAAPPATGAAAHDLARAVARVRALLPGYMAA